MPFSSTFPGMAALLLALGMLHRDGAFVIAGRVAVVVTLIYFAVMIGGAICGGIGLGAIFR